MTDFNFPAWRTRDKDKVLEDDLTRAFNYLRQVLPGVGSAVGSMLLWDGSNWVEGGITKTVTTDFDLDTTGTLEVVTPLSGIPIVADQWYYYDYLLRGSATSAVPDIKVTLDVPSPGVIESEWYFIEYVQHNTAHGADFDAGFGTAFTGPIDAGDVTIRIQGTLKCTTTGVLDLQAAQDTSDAAITSVLPGSTVRVERRL